MGATSEARKRLTQIRLGNPFYSSHIPPIIRNNIRWHAWHVAKHVSYDERIWGNLGSGLEVIRHFDISALLRICLVKMEPGFGMVVCRLSTFDSTAFYWIGVRRWSRLDYFAANSDWICLASAGLG